MAVDSCYSELLLSSIFCSERDVSASLATISTITFLFLLLVAVSIFDQSHSLICKFTNLVQSS